MNERLPISLCINTLDAGTHLADCIESCRDWVAEIVVGDMGSSDNTLAIARSYGARILEIPPAGIVEPGRQALIDAARQPWVLVLDADERAHAELASFARDWIADEDVAGVRLPRQNYLFGKWLKHSGYWPDYQLRLFRAGRVTWPRHVHARPSVDGRAIKAPAQPEVALIHLNYRSIEEWVERSNRYTSHEIQSPQRLARFRIWRLLTSPLKYFAYYYFYERGFRDGAQGLWVAVLMGIYGALIELKRWERQVVESRSSAPPEAAG
jgi:glycosyltransferase involved in cell wall biosynthesis